MTMSDDEITQLTKAVGLVCRQIIDTCPDCTPDNLPDVLRSHVAAFMARYAPPEFNPVATRTFCETLLRLTLKDMKNTQRIAAGYPDAKNSASR